jgi:hypothetical protein
MAESLKQERQTKKAEGNLDPAKQGKEQAASELGAEVAGRSVLIFVSCHTAALTESYRSITRANGSPAANVRARTRWLLDVCAPNVRGDADRRISIKGRF